MIGTRVICAADGKHTYSERAIVESHGLGRSEPVKCLPLPRWLSVLFVWCLGTSCLRKNQGASIPRGLGQRSAVMANRIIV